jgi:hypothetical protein
VIKGSEIFAKFIHRSNFCFLGRYFVTVPQSTKKKCT